MDGQTEGVQFVGATLNLLNRPIWEFVYFVWGLSPSKRRVVRWRNFASRRVQTMCKTLLGFMSIRVVVTKN